MLKRIKASGVNFEGKVVNILKDRSYLHFNDELPVILVDEEPASKIKVDESMLRLVIQRAASQI